MRKEDLSVISRIKSALDRLPGELAICIAALLWSSTGGVIKSFEMDALLLPALRAPLAGLVLLPFVRWKEIVWDRWLFGTILSYAGLCGLILSAIRLTTASNALALQFTSPLWVYLYCLFVLKRKRSARKTLPIACMALGIAVILLEPHTGSNTLGNILGALSGIGLAGFTAIQSRTATASLPARLALCNFGTAILLSAILSLRRGFVITLPPGTGLYLLLLVLILNSGYIFYMTGSSKVTPQKATLIGALEFVLTPLWAFLLAGEVPSLYGAAGWVLLLAAVLLEMGTGREFSCPSDVGGNARSGEAPESE